MLYMRWPNECVIVYNTLYMGSIKTGIQSKWKRTYTTWTHTHTHPSYTVGNRAFVCDAHRCFHSSIAFLWLFILSVWCVCMCKWTLFDFEKKKKTRKLHCWTAHTHDKWVICVWCIRPIIYSRVFRFNNFTKFAFEWNIARMWNNNKKNFVNW